MKINPKILSIPPYISTSWKNVISLSAESKTLYVGLLNGSVIEVPQLEEATIQAAFEAHQKHVEQEAQPKYPLSSPEVPGLENTLALPLQLSIEGNFGNILQHNQEASHTPNLPPEVINKISTLARTVGLGGVDHFPKPEPHCNCIHCQVMRAIHQDQDHQTSPQEKEDEVSDEDLTFRDWQIKQTAEQLYLVTNPIRLDEHYNVFLGDPVGCTCGEKNCEHIRAVLNS